MIAVAAATANILRITATYPSTRIAAARGDHHAPITSTKRSEQRQNRESRAKDARWTRILTFILSLAGRGDRTSTSLCKRFLVLGDFAFLHSLGELPGDNLFDRLRLPLFKDALLLEEVINPGTHMFLAHLDSHCTVKCTSAAFSHFSFLRRADMRARAFRA